MQNIEQLRKSSASNAFTNEFRFFVVFLSAFCFWWHLFACWKQLWLLTNVVRKKCVKHFFPIKPSFMKSLVRINVAHLIMHWGVLRLQWFWSGLIGKETR